MSETKIFDKEKSKKEILNLIQIFKSNIGKEHTEDDVCRAYLLPLFEHLGWNTKDLNEVKGQKSQPDGRPDYIFYLNESIAFFLEAKKIKELTTQDIKQAVNYARNNNKRWAVLSNFQDTYILICDIKEKNLQNHILKRINYTVLDAHLDEILLLSRESFEREDIDKYAELNGRIKTKIKIDEELLDDVLLWRKKLIHSIKENNKKEYEQETLEEIVQTILDRIIFIRTIEDRKIEAKADDFIKNIVNQYEKNKNINIQQKLNDLFKQYDAIYDSKLFTYDEKHFETRHECEIVKIDNETLYKILKETYEKDEIYAYNFADIDADVLVRAPQEPCLL